MSSSFNIFSSFVYESKVHLLLILVQILFSGWQIIGSVALKDGANPLVVALYRQTMASIFLLIIIWFYKRDALVIIPSKDYPRFIYVGFCSFLNVVGTLFALEYLSPTTYAIMQPIVPVLATAVSFLAGFESLNWLKSVGIVIAVCGAIIIQMFSNSNSTNSSSDGDTESDDQKNLSLGMIIVLAQCFGDANCVVFQKPLVKKYYSVYVTALFYAIGAFITGILSIGLYPRFSSREFYFDGVIISWLAVAYCIFITSMFCYGAISWSVKRVSPSVATIFYTLQPVATVVFMFLLFTKVPTLVQAIGGVMVALGLVATVRGRYEEQQSLQFERDRKKRATVTSIDAESSLKQGSDGSIGSSLYSKNSSVLSSVLSQEDHPLLLGATNTLAGSGTDDNDSLDVFRLSDGCSYTPVGTPSPMPC